MPKIITRSYIKKYKVRLIVPEGSETERFFLRCAGANRFIYNYFLERYKKSHDKFFNHYSSRDILKELQLMYPWMKELPSHTLDHALHDLETNVQRSYKDRKKELWKISQIKSYKKRVVYKKKRKWHKYELNYKTKRNNLPSFYMRNDSLKIAFDAVKIEKLGWVQFAEKNYIPFNAKKGKKNAITINESLKYGEPRIKYDGRYWWLSVSMTCETQTVKGDVTADLGIDLGVDTLAHLSNDMKFNYDKHKLKELEKRIVKVQKKLSSSMRWSNNNKKLRKELLRLHSKVRNHKMNVIFHMAKYIMELNPHRVVMETLFPKNMMKCHKIAKSVGHAMFKTVFKVIRWKCDIVGIPFFAAKWDFPSSKTCSHCGFIHKCFGRSEKTFVCPECGHTMHRDLNAAINLANYNGPYVTDDKDYKYERVQLSD